MFNDMNGDGNHILSMASQLQPEEFWHNQIKHHTNSMPINKFAARGARRYPSGNDTQQRYQSSRQNAVPQPLLQKTHGIRNDCDRHSANAPFETASSKAIMLHLNLFPKTMKSSTAALRRQPLHNNFSNEEHQPIQFDSKFGPQFNSMLMNNIVDANQIKTAASNPEIELHLKSTLATNTNVNGIGYKILNDTDHLQQHQQYQPFPPHHDTAIVDRQLETIAAEAQIASLFRFPVESLQQFQAHDAM